MALIFGKRSVDLLVTPVPVGEDRTHRNKSTTTSTTSQSGIVQTKSEITASTIKIETT
jgi:hypothetical protein